MLLPVWFFLRHRWASFGGPATVGNVAVVIAPGLDALPLLLYAIAHHLLEAQGVLQGGQAAVEDRVETHPTVEGPALGDFRGIFRGDLFFSLRGRQSRAGCALGHGWG